ncbi:MAG: PHP domain-containing protein [Desulfoferrobacter sp.]
MLKFARNKLVTAAREDKDTLSIHGILDDDIYSVEIDLRVRIRDLHFLSIDGKWNRWTTPECPRAIDFLQEAKGFCIDEGIDDRIHKAVGRKACRHFANLLIECCHAAKEAAKVARWEDAKAVNQDLSFGDFRIAKTDSEDGVASRESAEKKPTAAQEKLVRISTVRAECEEPQSTGGRPENRAAGFVIDLHVHTFPASPCSSAPEDRLIEEAKRIGLNGICLTDHNHVWTPAQVEDLSQRHGFLILRGNEITTDQGDMLVFGLESDIKKIIKLQDLRAEVLRAEGFIVAAHPFRGFLTFGAGQLGLTPERAGQRALFQWVDAVEVLNGKVTDNENRLAASVAANLGLPATGGSDAHDVAEVGHYATRFSTNIQTEADLLAALKSDQYEPVAFRKDNEQVHTPATYQSAEQ